MLTRKEIELEQLKMNNALDALSGCVANMAKELAELKEQNEALKAEVAELKEQFAEAVNKGIEDRWNKGLERIMNYDINTALGR